MLISYIGKTCEFHETLEQGGIPGLREGAKHSVCCLQNSVQFLKQSVTCLHNSVQYPKLSVTCLQNSEQYPKQSLHNSVKYPKH